MFFKGALLSDPKALLREQGEHSRSSLRLEFRSVADVTSMKSALCDLVADAVRAQEARLRVKETCTAHPPRLPGRIGGAHGGRSAFRDAFERLTPGRQRGYLLHFNGAKQSATRAARIERVQDRIMEGFGMHD
jgi:uncharacterized protein YdeI (YjbR/CyaY-like superfamily)